LGYSRTQLYALVAQGDLPKPIRIGRGQSGAVGIPLPWLDAVIAAHAAGQLT
jgi:predicted DNA-binding transcriptional regulator AlpA